MAKNLSVGTMDVHAAKFLNYILNIIWKMFNDYPR